jgi:polyisoprenoid-binding protein YceI
MPIGRGSHVLGPDNAKLLIHTGRRGGAAKAGHDLLLEVTSWRATLDAADDPTQTRMSLTADSTSLRVLEGTGGMMPLGDSDKDNIRQTIDDEVLKRTAIEFHSTSVKPAGEGAFVVQGELELFGRSAPVSFTLRSGERGRLTAEATVTQSAWGIKPYSALFGALKVADELRVELDADLAATGS